MNFNINELQLIHFADPVMRTKPPEFDFQQDGDKAKELADVLHKKMIELNGAGLSANQVGLPYRMFVFGNAERRYAFFNPQIIGVSKEQDTMEEGCLSFPGFFLTLRRPKEVAVSYQDEEGTQHTAALKGVLARIVLHEYDHMEGINFTHHASHFKLKYTLERMAKRQKKLLRGKKHGK